MSKWTQQRIRQRMASSSFMAALGFCAVSLPAIGQVVPPSVTAIATDGTFGSAIVITDGLDGAVDGRFTIQEGFGSRPGNGANLFHSLGEFDVATGDTAVFRSSAGVDRIITQVTDSDAAAIFGRIQSSDTNADLFFLSPNGFVFGAGSRLLVNGSATFATADYLRMLPGDTSGSMTFSGDVALATANPIAFGFLGGPIGGIELDNTFLQGAAGTRIAFLGGDITATDSFVEVSSGAIELVSLAGAGEILLNAEGAPSVAASVARGRIEWMGSTARIRQPSSPNPFTNSILVDTGDLILDDGDLASIVESSAAGGDVRVAVSRGLEMRNGSQIRAEVDSFTAGLGGSVVVNAETIRLFDRSEISTASQGSGAAGGIAIVANEIELRSGGAIESIGLGTGDGGDIDITANQVSLIGGLVSGVLSQPSSITSTAGFNGADAGDIRLQVGVLDLMDGGRISADTLGAGDGGMIAIEADSIRVAGVNDAFAAVLPLDFDIIDPNSSGGLNVSRGPDYARSGIAAASLSTNFGSSSTAGDAGDIQITTDRLVVTDHGLISANSSTFAEAGSVVIDAGSIRLGQGALIDSSSLINQAAGVALRADEIRIDGAMVNASSGASAATGGGSIVVDSTGLLFVENSVITSNFDGPAGSGGDIQLVGAAVVIGGNAITANASIANGGAVDVSAGVLLDLGANVISATGGAAGTQGTVSVASPEVNLAASASPLPIQYIDASSMLRPACAAQTIAGGDSSFVLQARRAYPSSPEGILVAFDAATGGDAESSASIAFNKGDYAEASEKWLGESKRLEAAGQSQGQLLALRGAAQSQFAGGRYAEAVQPLKRALSLANERGDRVAAAAALGDLGNAYLALGELDAAEGSFTRGLGMLKKEDDAAFTTRLLNSLGNLHAARNAHAAAIEAYQRSAARAEAGNRTLDAARAFANAARSAFDAEQLERSALLLAHGGRKAVELQPSLGKLYLLIHLARTHQSLAMEVDRFRKSSLISAHQLLVNAVEMSEDYSDERARSFALGNLGSLYEVDGRIDEALYLTRQALAASENANAAEAIYRWHWQEGRLLWGRGHAEDAIAAYRRALSVLEESRQASADRYDASQWSFERSIGAVYYELADRLLQASDRIKQPALNQALLFEARTTMERLRAAELRDYFDDECVADLAQGAGSRLQLPESVAIVYPILFEDHVDILVQTSAGLEHHSNTRVGRRELEAVAAAFRKSLQKRAGNGYRKYSRKLYDWLLDPVANRLSDQGVTTLLFVSDGALRTIPMGALHDGKGFLVDRFAVANAPALGLIDPAPFKTSPERTLLAGVSESVGGFPALAAVESELASVHEILGGEVLLNESFQRSRLEELFAQRSPSVVHVASHAVFRGDPNKSFLLAHDGPLTMNRLGNMVGQGRRSEPLELLVLSACETALGDDRAGLGLAGVAIRAGARSALGSLWNISDNAAAILVTGFYRELMSGDKTKAQALQQAQLALREDPKFSHPFFWSPYLLVSGWL